MRVFPWAIFGSLLLSGAAAAADLPTKVATAPAFAPTTSWTGLYVGINGGGVFTNADVRDPECGFSCADKKVQAIDGTFGGQIGYNWQHRSMVLGLEGDWNWVGFKDSGIYGTIGVNPGNATLTFDRFASVRARAGLAVDNALVYVTAGPVWGHFDSTVTFRGIPPVSTSVAHEADWKIGLAVGMGMEYQLATNWSLRGEYLFLGFPDMNPAVINVTTGALTCSAVIGNCVQNITYSAHVARAALNYKFW